MEMELEQYASLCDGINAYYTYIFNLIFNYDKPNIELTHKQIIYAKVAFIETIMQYFEEHLLKKEYRENSKRFEMISKTNNEFFARTVDCLFKKNSNGKYEYDGREIDNIEFLLHIIRDKFSHAQYKVDYEKEEVIININNNTYIFPIDNLMDYCMSGDNSCLFQKTNVISRNISYFSKDFKVDFQKNPSDVDFYIDKFVEERVSLTVGGGRLFTYDEIKIFHETMKIYNNCNNKQKQELFLKMKEEYAKKGYILSSEKHRLIDKKDKDNIKEIYKNNIYSKDETNENLYLMLGSEIHKHLNKDLEQFNVSALAIKNLRVLDVMDKKNEFDIEKIKEYLDFSLNINEDFITCSLIAMFNIYFSYAFEKYLYKNDVNVGDYLFDFNKLDTSKFNVIIEKRKSHLLDAAIKHQENLLELAKKQNITSRNASKMQKVANQIQVLKDKIKHYNDTKVIADNYYNRNLYIIDGIRNSIGHGNYRLISKKSIADSIIEFTDIDNDVETFKCEISLEDFSRFISDCFHPVAEFIIDKTDKNIR